MNQFRGAAGAEGIALPNGLQRHGNVVSLVDAQHPQVRDPLQFTAECALPAARVFVDACAPVLRGAPGSMPRSLVEES